MTTPRLFALVCVLLVGAGSAAAQTVTLEFQNGNVRLTAQNASVSQILAEWARRGRTTIVNGERVPGPPVTLELNDVPEQQALDVVLRSASGYLVAGRENVVSGASAFDRILILPTSSRPAGSPALPSPLQSVQAIQDDSEENDGRPQQVPQAPRGGLPANPGARVPPGNLVQPGVAVPSVPPPLNQNDEPAEPQNRPANAPSNPFGVAPGTTRPGVVSPVPQATRPGER